jgi:hypothetical protein
MRVQVPTVFSQKAGKFGGILQQVALRVFRLCGLVGLAGLALDLFQPCQHIIAHQLIGTGQVSVVLAIKPNPAIKPGNAELRIQHAINQKRRTAVQAAKVKQGDLIIGDFVHAHGHQMSKTALTIARTTINETDALATNAQPDAAK